MSKVNGELLVIDPNNPYNETTIKIMPDKRRSIPCTKVQLLLLLTLLAMLVISLSVAVGILLSKYNTAQDVQKAGANVSEDDYATDYGYTVETDDVILKEQCPYLWSSMRLPTALVPYNYDLTYRIDFARNRFIGRVDIHVNCSENTFIVLVHAMEMNITAEGVSVTDMEYEHNVSIECQAALPGTSMYIIKLNEEMLSSRLYLIRFEVFAGFLQDDGDSIRDGLYSGSYTDSAGRHR